MQAGRNSICVEDLLYIIEKEFDYSFGQRMLNYERKPGTEEHIDKIAEIGRQK